MNKYNLNNESNYISDHVFKYIFGPNILEWV